MDTKNQEAYRKACKDGIRARLHPEMTDAEIESVSDDISKLVVAEIVRGIQFGRTTTIRRVADILADAAENGIPIEIVTECCKAALTEKDA